MAGRQLPDREHYCATEKDLLNNSTESLFLIDQALGQLKFPVC